MGRSNNPISMLRLVVRSLVYHWRIQLAVAAGVAAGTAVLTGALLVGDSMRGSLRDLTLERLGRIDLALMTDRFFRAELADELASSAQFRDHFSAAVPVVLLRAAVRVQAAAAGGESSAPAQANGVNLVACDERFWQLGEGGPDRLPGADRIIINQALAERLSVPGPNGPRPVEPGDRVAIRLPRRGTIPADSLLGDKGRATMGFLLVVDQVIADRGLGRFSLNPGQQRPLNAFVSLDLAAQIAGAGRVNALLVAGRDAQHPPSPEVEALLQQTLRPTLEDYGIRVEQVAQGYLNITTDQMLFPETVEKQLLGQLHGLQVQPALVYLANTLKCRDREIPYSMVAAVDPVPEPPLGPFRTLGGEPIGPLAESQIVLNQWAAEDLHAAPGDLIELTYFEPDSPYGRLRETTRTFRLAGVVAMEGPAADPHFTPQVAGVTDKDSIRDWDAPFEPFHPERIRVPSHPGPGNDEDYWNRYGTTPKALVSLAAGRKLWSSRFGRTTSLRVAPAEGLTPEALRRRLQLDPATTGFVLQPVKRQGLAASAGTTSFAGLFIGFSFFVIAAAVMLVVLLFRLGVDSRASQVGLLLALGFSRRRTGLLLAGEGLMVAAAGGLVGAVAGAGYAALMLAGLHTWWVEAIVTPFLQFHASPASFVIGYLSGLVLALAAVVWGLWYIRRTSSRALLGGQTRDVVGQAAEGSPWPGILAAGMAAVALLLGGVATRLEQEAQAGAFFGAGFLVLGAYLTLLAAFIRKGAVRNAVAVGRGNLWRLAARNLGRHPARSTLTAGLVAAASFLIVSIGAFRIDPSQQAPKFRSGNGGFALVAECARPVFADMNRSEHLVSLGFSRQELQQLAAAKCFALRVRDGEDASCLNLYKPRQPRMLGVPEAMIDRGGFVIKPWVKTTEAETANPWLLLKRALPAADDGAPQVPVLVDAATAGYSLHLARGGQQSLQVTNSAGQAVRLTVVGVLPGSIFQGDLLVSETALLEQFPEVAGYRFLLFDAPPDRAAELENLLERVLADYGLEAETAGRRLARFLVVQNTYLSTFQSLGALGLLLGTLGLAAVQLRNVMERRSELALLRATGFRRRTLALLLVLENAAMLLLGLAGGVIAALVAVLPHLFSGTAGLPWTFLLAALATVLGTGLVAGLAAVRAVVRAPLLAALRRE